VLATGLGLGSHLNKQFENAKSLSNEKDMNVTFYTYSDFKPDFEDTDSLHFFRFPFLSKNYIEVLREKHKATPVKILFEWH